MSYAIRIREVGGKRRKLVGKSSLTTKWVHAIRLVDIEAAEEYARWLVANNGGALEAPQVVDWDGRVVREVSA